MPQTEHDQSGGHPPQVRPRLFVQRQPEHQCGEDPGKRGDRLFFPTQLARDHKRETISPSGEVERCPPDNKNGERYNGQGPPSVH